MNSCKEFRIASLLWLCILAIGTPLSVLGEETIFAPPECTFVITFPGKAEVGVAEKGGVRSHTAIAHIPRKSRNATTLTAECTPFNRNYKLDAEQIHQMLLMSSKAIHVQMGVYDENYYFSGDPRSYYELSSHGKISISGIAAAYQYKAYFDGKSALVIRAITDEKDRLDGAVVDFMYDAHRRQ